MAEVLYTTPAKVAALLQITDYTDSTKPKLEDVRNWIYQAMQRIDMTTHHAWRETQVTEEIHDIPASWKYTAGIQIPLQHRDVKTFDTTKLDKIELWNGSTYDDYVATKTQGRNNDYWLDPLGTVFLRTWSGIRPLGVKVTYRFGGKETLANGSLTDSIATITVDSTAGFQMRGRIIIDAEEILYDGKTTTTFTNCTRGAFDTTAASHLDDALVYDIPLDIEEAATKMVAILALQQEDKAYNLPEGSDQLPYDVRIGSWKKNIRNILSINTEVLVFTRY